MLDPSKDYTSILQINEIPASEFEKIKNEIENNDGVILKAEKLNDVRIRITYLTVDHIIQLFSDKFFIRSALGLGYTDKQIDEFINPSNSSAVMDRDVNLRIYAQQLKEVIKKIREVKGTCHLQSENEM